MSQEPSCWQWTGRETLSLVAFINVFTPWQDRRPGLARLSPPSTPGSLGVSFCVCPESSLGVSALYTKRQCCMQSSRAVCSGRYHCQRLGSQATVHLPGFEDSRKLGGPGFYCFCCCCCRRCAACPAPAPLPPHSRPSFAGGFASRPALSSRVLLSAIAEVIRRNKVVRRPHGSCDSSPGCPFGSQHLGLGTADDSLNAGATEPACQDGPPVLQALYLPSVPG